jgi:hypothetical protein
MLFIHGGLYYWREVDVDTWLEERHAGRFTGHGDDEAIARASVVDIGKMPGHGRPGSGSSRIMPNPVADVGVKSADIEMAPASPSLAAGRVYINEPRVDPPRTHGDPFVNPMDYWYLRKSPNKNFEWGRWWRGLHLTRKWVRADFLHAHMACLLSLRSLFVHPVVSFVSCCFCLFPFFLCVGCHCDSRDVHHLFRGHSDHPWTRRRFRNCQLPQSLKQQQQQATRTQRDSTGVRGTGVAAVAEGRGGVSYSFYLFICGSFGRTHWRSFCVRLFLMSLSISPSSSLLFFPPGFRVMFFFPFRCLLLRAVLFVLWRVCMCVAFPSSFFPCSSPLSQLGDEWVHSNQ